jgi:hypothetical protein
MSDMGAWELALTATALAMACAVPIALLLWLAAQFLETRVLARRVRDVEHRLAAMEGDAEAVGTGTDAAPSDGETQRRVNDEEAGGSEGRH